MAPSNPKLMRAALREAIDLYEHEYCYADGRIINTGTHDPSIGAQWLMNSRAALGLDPITGKRIRTPQDQQATAEQA